MKLLLIILFTLIMQTALASDCLPKDFPDTKRCFGFFHARSIADLEKYHQSLESSDSHQHQHKHKSKRRFSWHKFKSPKHLIIDFNIQQDNLAIHTPCMVLFDRRKTITANNICIEGKSGIITSSDNKLSASNNIDLLSEHGAIYLGKGIKVDGMNLKVDAQKRVAIFKSAKFDIDQKIDIQTNRSKWALIHIDKNTQLSAQMINLMTSGNLSIKKNSKLIATDNIFLSAKKCHIDKKAKIQAPIISGSCYNSQNLPPTAVIDVPNNSGEAPFSLEFNGSNSTDPDGSISQYFWEFGNGDTATTAIVNYTYLDPGEYEVKLTVTDNEGATHFTTTSIIVNAPNMAPIANLSCNQTNARLDFKVECDGSLSQDLDGSIVSYSFNMGDGTFIDSTTPKINHTYSSPGTYLVLLTVTDNQGLSSTASIDLDIEELNINPVAQINYNQIAGEAPFTVNFDGGNSSDSDGQVVEYLWSFSDGGQATGATVSHTFTSVGEFSATLTVKDDLGGMGSIQSGTIKVVPENQTPIAKINASETEGIETLTTTLSASESTDDFDNIVSFEWNLGDGSPIQYGETVAHTFDQVGEYFIKLQVTDGGGKKSNFARKVVAVIAPAPVDPKEIAPPLAQNKQTLMSDSIKFLYEGPNAIQTGVAAETIKADMAAVNKGRVLDNEGYPLSGVVINCKDHPEFGQTITRSDGEFDFVVNGGKVITLEYKRPGYLDVQRKIKAAWNEFTRFPDVVMIPLDEKVNPVKLSDIPADSSVMVAASTITDSYATRTNKLLINSGTTAQMIMPNGSKVTLDQIDIRTTEYTVGDKGPNRMPADLPLGSSYTYAIEFTVDQALEAGATSVEFDQPLYTYVENIVDMPVGSLVPAGYYDKKLASWIPEENGIVLKVLDIVDGKAVLDTRGNSSPAIQEDLDLLEITESELENIANNYQVGTEFWRVPIKHFSPHDINYLARVANPDEAYAETLNQESNPGNAKDATCPTVKKGSIVNVNDCSLGEIIEVAGTDFDLVYNSKSYFVPNRDITKTIKIATVAQVGVFSHVTISYFIAGNSKTERFPITGDQSYTIIWDGKDIYGRDTNGSTPLSYTLTYETIAQYTSVGEAIANSVLRRANVFGTMISEGVLSENGTRTPATISKKFDTVIEIRDTRNFGMGSWSLDKHHYLDLQSGDVYLGSGERIRSTENQRGIIKSIEADSYGYDLEVDSDNYIYTFKSSDINHGLCIVKVDQKTGESIRFAGLEDCSYDESKKNNTNALDFPISSHNFGIEIGPNNEVYFASGEDSRIYKISQNGLVSIIAGLDVYEGREVSEWNFDSVLNKMANQVTLPIGPIDFTKNNDLLIFSYNGIYRVDAKGILNEFWKATKDSDPRYSYEIQVSNEDEVFYNNAAETYHNAPYPLEKVHLGKITSDGTVIKIINADEVLPTNQRLLEGQDAAKAFSDSYSFDFGPDGSLYIADLDLNYYYEADQGYDFVPQGLIVRKIDLDNKIHTVFGDGENEIYDNDWKELFAKDTKTSGINIAFDKENKLIIDAFGSPKMGAIYIPGIYSKLQKKKRVAVSVDGSEFYEFNDRGQHLKTIDSLTNTTKYIFNYDSNDKLISIVDRDNKLTQIQRDASGNPLAIVSPFGLTTNIAIDSNNLLASVTNPNNETNTMTYNDKHILGSFTNPRGKTNYFLYNENRELVEDQMANNGSLKLVKAGISRQSEYGRAVTTTSSEGVTSTVEDVTTSKGDIVNRVIDINGNQSFDYTFQDGRTISQSKAFQGPMSKQGPSERFGLLSPFVMETGEARGITSNFYQNFNAFSENLEVEDLTDVTSPIRHYQITRTDSQFNTSTDTYDGPTKTLTSTSREGRSNYIKYNEKGRVSETKDSNQETINFSYDNLGNLITETWGDRVTSYEYDPNTNFLVSSTDPLGRSTNFEYDNIGRITKSTNHVGEVTLYSYDENGNLISLTPPSKPTHYFSYDAVDKMLDYTPPMGNFVTTYQYDLDKRVLGTSFPNSKSITTSYRPGFDQVQTMTDNGTGETTTYDYFDTTQVKSITSTSKDSISYEYNGNRVRLITQSGQINSTISINHDNFFNISRMVVFGSPSIRYTYDRDELLIGAGNLVLNRNPANVLIESKTLGSITENQTYNSFHEIESISVNGIFNETIQERDKLGRITKKSEVLQGQTKNYIYEYDQSDRLSKVYENGSLVSDYIYDQNGNRLSSIGLSQPAELDDQDRMLSYGKYTFNYDEAGYTTKITDTDLNKDTSLDYDSFDNLRTVNLPNGDKIEYVVNTLNQRVAKKINGVIQYGLIYKDQLNPIAQTDKDSNVLSRFIYGEKENVPEYMIKGGVEYKIVSDHLGSVRFVINASDSSVIQRLDYDEFGNVLFDSNPGFQPFGYAGGLYDHETGLVRFGSRDYNPRTGRWMSKDPLRFDDGTNLYAYAGNDPINYIDPTGKSAAKIIAALAAASALYLYLQDYDKKVEDAKRRGRENNAKNRAKGKPAFDDYFDLNRGKDKNRSVDGEKECPPK